MYNGLMSEPLTSFNGWGVSAFDSLDTMLLMGLEGEYQRALPLVEKAEFALEDVSPPALRNLLAYHPHLRHTPRKSSHHISKQSSDTSVVSSQRMPSPRTACF